MLKRNPAVAGQFYPKDPATLLAHVTMYIEQSKVEPAKGKVIAIIAPHAGYIYSGPTAGYSFARIRGKKINRAVLIGRSHRFIFDGLGLSEFTSFITPLGEFPIDISFYETLKTQFPCVTNQAHTNEHCLEVLLPFLYASVGIIPIVPILLGNEPSLKHFNWGNKLSDLVNEEDIVIASTDLSHYLSEESANSIDLNTIEKISQKNPEPLIEGLREETCSMCGAPAVLMAMGFAQSFGDYIVNVLNYTTSGKTSGDYSAVVGYTAITFEQKE